MAKIDFTQAAVVKSREEVAQHFGNSWRTIYRWEKQGMPVRPDGHYDLVQITVWRDRKKNKKENDPSPPPDPQKEEAARLAKIKADHEELKLRKLQGDLVEVVEVETMFAARALAFRQGAMGFARSLPPKLINCKSEREMEEVLLAAVRELLENVLRPLPEKFRGDKEHESES